MSIAIELIDAKIIRILELLISNKDRYFHLNKISKESKVPISTTFRIVNRLVELKLVEQDTIDKFKIYRIASNNKAKEMERLIKNER